MVIAIKFKVNFKSRSNEVNQSWPQGPWGSRTLGVKDLGDQGLLGDQGVEIGVKAIEKGADGGLGFLGFHEILEHFKTRRKFQVQLPKIPKPSVRIALFCALEYHTKSS